MFHVLIVVGSGRMMSVNDNTDKAVSLLREAAILLSGGRESEGNQDTASSTVGRSLTSPETVVTNSVSSSNHDQNRVLQNSGHFLLATDQLTLVHQLTPKGQRRNHFLQRKETF